MSKTGSFANEGVTVCFANGRALRGYADASFLRSRFGTALSGCPYNP
ncbi:MAG: hypothetical protein IJ207_08305 [Treponema sp.]|nr:hypothetical protein [Treponema sp.]MBQ9282184.1 hypothetical protein [Treponema sp.]